MTEELQKLIKLADNVHKRFQNIKKLQAERRETLKKHRSREVSDYEDEVLFALKMLERDVGFVDEELRSITDQMIIAS